MRKWLFLLPALPALVFAAACADVIGFPDVPNANAEEGGADAGSAEPEGGHPGSGEDASSAADDGGIDAGSDGAPFDATALDTGSPVDATPPPPRDSSVTPDASPDAADASDAAPPPFTCPAADPTAIFCSDFDHGGAAPWEWGNPLTTAKGSISLDTSDPLSPPNAFAAANVSLVTGDTYTLAALAKPLVSGASHIDYSFHLRVKAYDAGNNPAVTVAQLLVGAGTPVELSLELVVQAGELKLVQAFTGTDGGPQADTSFAGTLSPGTWESIDLALDRSGAAWSVRVVLDGGPALVTGTRTTPGSQSLEVDLGIVGLLPVAGANAFAFDDVLVRGY